MRQDPVLFRNYRLFVKSSVNASFASKIDASHIKKSASEWKKTSRVRSTEEYLTTNPWAEVIDTSVKRITMRRVARLSFKTTHELMVFIDHGIDNKSVANPANNSSIYRCAITV